MQTVKEGLQRSPSPAPLALMGALGVVVLHVNIQVDLDLVKTSVDLFPECYPIELVLHRLMEALADAVGLGMLCLCLRMLDLVEAQEELIGMGVLTPTELRSPISQDSEHLHTLLLEERQSPVVEAVGCLRLFSRSASIPPSS